MEINKGKIIIDIYELYKSMNNNKRKEFLKKLAWTDDIFNEIENDILNSYANTTSYNICIGKLREKLLEKIRILEKTYIQCLLQDLDKARKYEEYFRNSLWELEKKIQDWNFNVLPQEYRFKIPKYNNYPEINSIWDIKEYIEQIINKCNK